MSNRDAVRTGQRSSASDEPAWRGRGDCAVADVTVKVNDNGPYVIQGAFEVLDADGKAFETKAAVALCRCGQSANKPFCDGTHNKVSFSSEARAE